MTCQRVAPKVSAASAKLGGTATLRAVYASTTVDRVYNIAKSLAGAAGAPGVDAPDVISSSLSQALSGQQGLSGATNLTYTVSPTCASGAMARPDRMTEAISAPMVIFPSAMR